MDARQFMGYYIWALTIVILLFILFRWQAEEWQCEKDFNVYDCEYEWYPVYGEETEEELIS